jgi:hypothetical protein
MAISITRVQCMHGSSCSVRVPMVDTDEYSEARCGATTNAPLALPAKVPYLTSKLSLFRVVNALNSHVLDINVLLMFEAFGGACK